jgi:uncharacterized protein YabN with tetrapyrrole methylase and pyrophosphatase domain
VIVVNESLRNVASAASTLLAQLPGGTPPPGGSLTVVGTGIRAMTQLTIEALAAIANAEVLLHVIGEPLQEEAVVALNPHAETMTGFYAEGLDRRDTYEAMIERVVSSVIAGQRTVAAFYGHPGVFTYPSHESIRRVRAAGYPARMLPAISAEDCLWADLGIDPGDGCQSFEATDMLLLPRRIDPTAHLLLWQVGSVGVWTYASNGSDRRAFSGLVGKLMHFYPPTHIVDIYEASFHPGGRPRFVRVPLMQLDASMTTPASLLHVPPLPRAPAAVAWRHKAPGYGVHEARP